MIFFRLFGQLVLFVIWGVANFSLHRRFQTGSGAHPASHPVDTRGSSLWVKRPMREADHSSPSTAEIKNA